MAHKRKGQLTVLGEWAEHLRPRLRRAFWKRERQAERVQVAAETANVQPEEKTRPAEEHEADDAADTGHGGQTTNVMSPFDRRSQSC